MLERKESGSYTLSGVVNFDNAVSVEQGGRELLAEDLSSGSVVRIDLSSLMLADSSTLSVCLSWLRAAKAQNATLCLTGIPEELASMAKVCGIDQILQESTC